MTATRKATNNEAMITFCIRPLWGFFNFQVETKYMFQHDGWEKVIKYSSPMGIF